MLLCGIAPAQQVITPIPTHFSLRGLSVCLSSVTIVPPADLEDIWQVHLGSPMTHCVRWGVPDLPGEGEIWGVEPTAKTCNSKLLLPPGEYKRGVGLTYQLVAVTTAIPPSTRLVSSLLLLKQLIVFKY